MGLIQAAVSSATSVLGEQWKEYFYCNSMAPEVLMTRGVKRVKGLSSNRNTNDNIISNGSVIAIADGQCMIIVEQGKVVELCAEPGEYTYDQSTEPSIFTGKLSDSIKEVFKNMGKRFTFGGEAPKDQRVYYFNTKELIGNKYGTPNPVPFRVVDQRAGLDLDIAIKCFGEYSYKITNPILFYTSVAGNVAGVYTRDQLDSQLKAELLTALNPTFAKISAKGIRYSELPAHTTEIAEVLNEVLSSQWRDKRGIEVVSFAVSSVKASEEDEAKIKEMQINAAFMDPTRAAAHMVGAQAAAMQAAAKNEGGSAMAFMGMNMANAVGGLNAGSLYQMGAAQPQGWTCYCGATGNNGNFCVNCGSPKPGVTANQGWTCSCGTVNKGKFCSNCGSSKPAELPKYKCDKCGWEPEVPTNPPKFCPECGDKFDENDIVK